MPATVSIPARFNGPSGSGNGGYCAGVLAARLGDGPAEVSLRAPIPLQTPLSIIECGEGIRAMDGETLVAEARPAHGFDAQAPEPVGLQDAREAGLGYRGPRSGLFSHCFVCGRARRDCLGVFAGPVPNRRLVACTFTPPAWTADSRGLLRDEFVWAVLDCPTYFAAYLGADSPPIGYLARQRTRLLQDARAGQEHILLAWPLGGHGRKRLAGSALVSASGELLAISEALMIEPREEPRLPPSPEDRG